jgi:tRNA modification GTPase
MDDLHAAIGAAARKLLEGNSQEDPLITSSRHADALRRALAALRRADRETRRGGALDLVAAEVREALSTLGEVTGETATEDILDRIFSQFCVGK